MKVNYIVVHYSATYPDQNFSASDIDRMHKTRGFDKIGYHYFIRRNGMLEKGREENEVGAHTRGYNSQSIGVCWAGGCERETGPDVGVDNRTPEQTKTLINIINDLLTRYPNAKVVGHRDLVPTQCPGFDVRSWWSKITTFSNQEVEKLMREYTDKLIKLIGK